MRIFTAVDSRFPDYLSDESHLYTASKIEKIYFPETISDLQEIVKLSREEDKQITISGGGTGIAAGRVPLQDWIIATDEMRYIDNGIKWKDEESGIEYSYRLDILDDENAVIVLPVAITVKSIQNLVRELGWFYPPDPTERSAFIGGNFATNASGARSFKYGSTRDWIQGARLVLLDGSCITLDRSKLEEIGSNEYIVIGGYKVPRPQYSYPDTTKNVAGPVITNSSQSIDLFIGTDGIFGITGEISLRLIRPPIQILNIIVYCKTENVAIKLIEVAQKQREEGTAPIPLSVEYLDERASKIMRNGEGEGVIVILEQDANTDEETDDFVEYWVNKFDELGIEETSVAMTPKEIEHHKFLRHLIPETVNSLARSNNQPKLGTDYASPIRYLERLFRLSKEIGREFEEYLNHRKDLGESIGYAMWSHSGDSHVHLNLLPRDEEEKKYAKKLMVKMMKEIVSWNGTIAAEHGLGKKKFDGKPALAIMIGSEGLKEIHRMKAILDPKFLLNRGNLISY